ncbi:hypothetical protein DPMN_101934 [Dreissena polymorpha]|uniref:Uncharacterized protein n=1 Tax=Dreissena polymorpha TaxID=45954 RepID=A0A9D4LKC2_DREPO|nr:hypothetical protein DPMN_101934 [Dreissena polymorpha]
MKKAKTTDIKTDKKTDIATDKTNEKKLKKAKQFNQKENTAKKSFGKKLKHKLRKIMPFRKAVSLNESESKVSDRANNVLQNDDEALLHNIDLVQTEIKAPSTTEVIVHQEKDVNDLKDQRKNGGGKEFSAKQKQDSRRPVVEKISMKPLTTRNQKQTTTGQRTRGGKTFSRVQVSVL